MYTNADVLGNKMDLLKARVAALKPAVICVNEVKPKNERYTPMAAEYNMKELGYELLENNMTTGRERGQIMYILKEMDAKQVYMEHSFEENMAATINLKGGDRMCIVLIYRSQSTENTEELADLMKCVSNKGFSHLLMLGDFNYKTIDWELETSTNSKEITFLKAMHDNYLVQHIKTPTRQRGCDIPTILDLVMTNEEDMIGKIEHCSPLGRSDHDVLMIDFQCYWQPHEQHKTRKLYHKADFDSMRNELQEIDWDDKMEDLELADKWGMLDQILTELEDKFIPTTSRSTLNQSIPLSAKTRELIREKDKLHRKTTELKRQGKYEQAEMNDKIYCRVRNKVRKETRLARKLMEENVTKEAKANPKKVFGYMNSKSKVKPGIGKIHKDPDDPTSELTDDDQEKANIFSKYFIKVQKAELEDIIPQIPQKVLQTPMPDLEIDEEKVYKLLSNLNVTKSFGPDGKSPRILNETARQIAKPVKMIFEESLKRSQLPMIWLMAIISVVFKKGQKSMVENYRPISLTCILCKCLEKLIRDHILKHMVLNGLFSKNQFGFLPGRSTTLQLLHAIETWTEALDNGYETDCIYTDFKKAFDTVPHKKLLGKLKSYGICDQIVKWIEAFLSNRKQIVIINGKKSNMEEVISGVIQGSVLGPILFVLYINDLPELVRSWLLLFADDSKISRPIQSTRDQLVLQRDLHLLAMWSRKWDQDLHPGKLFCNTITTAGPNRQPERIYYLGYMKVQRSECEKDLGVRIDNMLQFDKHITEQVKIADKMAGCIRRSFRFLCKDIFKILYKTMVRCHVETSVVVWSPHLEKHIEQIEGVQRRATKSLKGMWNVPYEERLKQLELPTLKYRRLRGDMITTYRMLHGGFDTEVALPLIMKSDVTGRESYGNPLQLFQMSSRLDVKKFSYSRRIVPIWNSLPTEVVMAPSVETFKIRLDKFWSNQPMLFDYKESYNPTLNHPIRSNTLPCVED